jgi:hypothetical protein
MDPDDRSGSELYSTLAGAAWSEVAEPVRRFHSPGWPARRVGLVRMGRPSNALGRLIGRLLHLPQSGELVPAELAIRAEDGREKWIRKLDNRTLVTTQSAGPSGLLVERFGPLELNFRLVVKDGGLHFKQESAAFRLARIRLRIPGWASPRISATCNPVELPSRVRVWVRVDAPLIGLVLSYDGNFDKKE